MSICCWKRIHLFNLILIFYIMGFQVDEAVYAKFVLIVYLKNYMWVLS